MEDAILYRRLLERLEGWHGYGPLTAAVAAFPSVDVYVAGGAVRDVLLGRQKPSKDFDIFLGGAEVDAMVRALASTGALAVGPFGSPRWFPDPESNVYGDLIPIRNFYTGLWPCEDILDVVNQADFTGNAIAVEFRTGRVFDPQNGRRDLQKKLLRAVRFDYPHKPIVNGHSLDCLIVMWFRLLHYAYTLNLQIDAVTLSWLCRHRAFSAGYEEFASVFFRPDANALRVLEPEPALQ